MPKPNNKRVSKRVSKSKSRKSKSHKSRKSKNIQRKQRGGMDQACLSQYTNGKYNNESNIHNINPQARLDLDSSFVGYGGPLPLGSSIVGGGSCGSKSVGTGKPLPLGSSIVGGGSCGSQGVGTGSPKSETFKQYMNKLDSQLDVKVGGKPQIIKPVSPPISSTTSGGGYTFDPNDYIGGNPSVKGYDDNSPPALIGGKLMFGAPDQPICGSGSVSGGGRRRRSSNSRSINNKSKKSRKSQKYRKSRKNRQRGGDFTGFAHSKPADYADAFNGAPSVLNYPEDMSKRTYDEHQPVWSPNAI